MRPDVPAVRGVALVGYRGTGKSTVGRLVAGRLGWPFLDADAVLETTLGRSIRSVFEELGEPAFRDYEEAVLSDLTAVDKRVVATGGGAVIRESNRRALRRFGFVVWLTAEPSVLAERLRNEHPSGPARPALTAAGTLGEIDTVLRVRTPFYQEVSDAIVATDGRTPAAVAEAVLAALPRD